LRQRSLLHWSQLPPTVAATVVADIPSLVALEWGCLVALEWACEAVSTGMIVSTVIVSMRTMISSLSATSAFHGGGVGGGVRDGAGAIRTDINGHPYGYGYGYGYGNGY